MNRKENIFYNIVRNENNFTDLLCNLLQFTIFRDVFLRFLFNQIGLEYSVKKISYENVNDQYNAKDYGIPDIVIENDEICIIIENKIKNSQLTENQPEGYINFLEKEKGNKLRGIIFIVPATYYQKASLTKELKKHDNLHSGVVTWIDLIGLIESEGLNELNIIFKHFYSLLDDYFGIRKVIFTKEEIDMIYSSIMASSMQKLNRVTNEVINKLSQYKLQRISWDNIDFKDKNGNWVLNFGIWYEFWEKHNYPLVICISEKEYSPKAFEIFKKKYKYVHFLDTEANIEYLVKGIESSVIDSENNIELIVDIIEDFLSEVI